jgi:5-methylcytosine-specific restriction endonuclease McrA
MTVAITKRTQPHLITVGEVFGRLTATVDFEMRQRPDGRNRCFQRFECSCGTSVLLRPYTVKNGNTSSCGCVHTEVVKAQMTTHGLSKTREYRNELAVRTRGKRRALVKNSTAKKITKEELNQVLNGFNNQCWICKVELDKVVWDHYQPIAKGGAHIIENLRPACNPCNSRKNALWPFTDEKKTEIANVVRALRTTQAMPVTDRGEVHDVCHS